jgi:hypothetical protein
MLRLLEIPNMTQVLVSPVQHSLSANFLAIVRTLFLFFEYLQKEIPPLRPLMVPYGAIIGRLVAAYHV